MRISGEESARAAQVSNVTSAASKTAAEGAQASTGDTSPAAMVTLSAKAQQIGQVKSAVNAIPDVREDVVASLKQQIDSGQYKVSSSDIAEMMMRRHAADQVS